MDPLKEPTLLPTTAGEKNLPSGTAEEENIFAPGDPEEAARSNLAPASEILPAGILLVVTMKIRDLFGSCHTAIIWGPSNETGHPSATSQLRIHGRTTLSLPCFPPFLNYFAPFHR
jgi:hypothetical protein